MSEYGNNGHCHDCGGIDGHHFNDCIYDGTGGGGYSRHRSDTARGIILVLSVIFMAICPPIGAILFTIFLKM